MTRHFLNENYKINVKPGTFMFYARQAAEFERNSEHKDAMDMWKMAGRRARIDKNRDWAKAREAHCEKILEVDGLLAD